jgi:integrase
MKKEYPSYMDKMQDLESSLSRPDKKVIDEFFSFCRLSACEYKASQYKRHLIQFIDISEVSLSKFDQQIIEGIYRIIRDSTKEVCGKNETIKTLKRFVLWKFNDANLIRNLKAIPQRKGFNTKKLNPFTLVKEEEIEGMLRSCNTLKDKAMLTLFIELGLRPHELLALRWKDLSIFEDVAQIRIYANKTRETRVLPFKTSLIHILRWRNEYSFINRTEQDLLFPNPQDRSKQLCKRYLDMLTRKLCKKAKIRNIFPYLIRHTTLTKINKILPGKVAAAYGGHTEKTSAVYSHLSEQDIIQVVLDKVYNIKDPVKKQELEQRIEYLERTLNIVLEQTGTTLDNVKQSISKPSFLLEKSYDY